MAVIVANRDKPKDCAHCWNHFDCDRYDDYCAKTVEGLSCLAYLMSIFLLAF